jgi:hypothetical protein
LESLLSSNKRYFTQVDVPETLKAQVTVKPWLAETSS